MRHSILKKLAAFRKWYEPKLFVFWVKFENPLLIVLII
jgi:hypothetical protein